MRPAHIHDLDLFVLWDKGVYAGYYVLCFGHGKYLKFFVFGEVAESLCMSGFGIRMVSS